MMKSFSAVGFSVILSVVSTAATAQDIMSEAGGTTRSYSYIEGFYLLNLDDADGLPDNTDVDNPILFRASIGLTEHFSLRGEFTNLTATTSFPDLGFDAESDVQNYEILLRYRDTLPILPDTDWIAGLGFQRTTTNVEGAGMTFDESFNDYTANLGLRYTITPKTEFEIGINFIRPTDGGSISGVGEAALVYRIVPSLDIALGGISLTENNSYGIGLRYNWN